MIIVEIKKGHASLGKGSIKNKRGNKIILPKSVNALVNSILLSDCFNKTFQTTCPIAPDKMNKNSKLSKLIT